MKIGSMFSGFDVSALGMRAQRRKMDAIAENIANIETTRTPNGGPYKRKFVQFKSSTQQTFAKALVWSGIRLGTTNEHHLAGGDAEFTENENLPGGVEALQQEDPSPLKMVHDPSNPDADENGYVRLPNVNIVTEMVDMISASRTYEANVTAVNAAKAVAKDSLEI
jgi:flagellar basal-body rod protein FlgC